MKQNGFSNILVIVFIVILVAALSYFILNKDNPLSSVFSKITPAQKTTLLTAHFDLTLAGVTDVSKIATSTASGVLYLPVLGSCEINLGRGEYKVIDGDCAKDNVASFSLPANSTGEDSVTAYGVYAKSLNSTVSGSAECKKESDGTFCPIQSVVVVRSQDKSFTSDVSKLLENIYVDLNGGGSPQRYFLFDEALKDVFWTADPQGNKLVQLRFYPQTAEEIQQAQQDSEL